MKYSKDDVLKCEVTGITDYGVFVKVDDDYSGLIHISEISNKFVSDIQKIYMIGDIIDAKIVEIDENKKQIKLTIKGMKEKKGKKKRIEERGEGFSPLKNNLNDWINEKLEEIENNSKTS